VDDPMQRAVDSMMSGISLSGGQRSSKFADFVSALEGAELEQLARDVAKEARTKKTLDEFMEAGVFPEVA
jgi:hypothetical protein